MVEGAAPTEDRASSARLKQDDGFQVSEVMPVAFVLSATATGKRRNDVRVRMMQPLQRRDWELSSDEATAHGGEESAPTPLEIFAAGIATCFMTQVRSFSRAGGVRLDGLTVDGRFEWTLRPGARPADPYTAETGNFQLDIDMDSEASLESQQALVATAAKGCFAEAALNVPVSHRLRNGEDWVLCEVDR
jgi:uncharacterized OsmC-like protein